MMAEPFGGIEAMTVRLDQLVPVKQAAQTLPALLRRIEEGEGPLILTRRGKPKAMIVALPTSSEGEGR